MSDGVLKNLEPSEVFYYFEELSKIPRGSGNEEAVSNYLVSFAKKHNLEVIQDEALNVLIKKPGTPGYEHSPAVILQGHMDMVCEKDPEVNHDFLKDPLRLQVHEDKIRAQGTTLGADNGIAVAMGLALLAAKDLPHPPLEVLVTTSEETGMDGAHAFDPQSLSGKNLINLDSEEEGVFTVSCAGGSTLRISHPLVWESPQTDWVYYALKIEGLKGGHSGLEIDKGRANAIKLLARFLNHLTNKLDMTLSSMEGGSKHNAIPREAKAVIGILKEDQDLLPILVSQQEAIFREEYRTADPDIRLLLCKAEDTPKQVMSNESFQQVLQFLYLTPNGVQSMSMDIPGLVESSLNLGTIATLRDRVEIISSIRSSVGSIKLNLFQTVAALAELTNAQVIEESSYPEWRYNPDSKFRTLLTDLYEEMFDQKPRITALHAGLECAIFDEKFDGQVDMISLGPNIVGVHTTQEALSISSTRRTWEFLKEALKRMK